MIMKNLFFLLFIFLSCDRSDISDSVNVFCWEETNPEEVGLNSNLLSDLSSELDAGNLGKVSSILIIKNNKLAYEHYRLGMFREKLHVNYSVTKSITSCLVGIAVDSGLITNTDDTILSYFTQYSSIQNYHIWKEDITIEHLLQMRAGIEWDESTYNYGSPLNTTTQMINSSDWLKFILDQPMSDEPGTDFTYNSGCTVLLSGLLEEITGLTAEQYAKSNLFNPLGITNYAWQKGPNTLTNTGFGLSLAPCDMAKFGQLYLNKGMWNGQQIISESWINKSFLPYTSFDEDYGYGYQWWLFPYDFGNGIELLPYANGHGNQYIFVIDKYDMVLVITSENFNRDPSFIREILTDYVLEAAAN